MTQLEELEDKCTETDFGAALCGLTILRCVPVTDSRVLADSLAGFIPPARASAGF